MRLLILLFICYYFAISFVQSQCGPNKIYSNCASACPRSCGDDGGPVICPAICRIGCTCQGIGGILQEKDCGPNMEFVSCGSGCPPKCGASNEPGICPAICRIGCMCKSGYVYKGEECVLPEQC
ncbi:hypothetical protein Trydic_g14846 [Trypoxylus dichotomus]